MTDCQGLWLNLDMTLTTPQTDCEWCGEARHESEHCPNRDPFAVEDWNDR